MPTIRHLVTVLAFTFAVAGADAFGQAYCRLRDPVTTIYDMYPEAETYRSIVRTIDEDVRVAVNKRVGFDLHFNELGRHTLYVPATDGRPLGLIHVRSEKGAWGLVEIAWSFDSSMRVREFRFQRCRSKHRRDVEGDAFTGVIAGKSFAELRALLDDDAETLRTKIAGLPEDAAELAVTVIRSSLKTIAVTESAWASDIASFKMLDHAFSAFPDGRSVQMTTAPFTPDALQAIARQLDHDPSSNIDRDTAIALRVLNAQGDIVGYAYRTHWTSMGHDAVLWWNIGSDLTVTNVMPEGAWPHPDVAQSFRQVVGMSIDHINDCSTATMLLGAELLIVTQVKEK